MGLRTILVGLVFAVALIVVAGGQAAGAPAIAWSPTTSAGIYDYGAVTPGQTASQTFTLRNSGGSGTGALTVSRSGSTAFSISTDSCTGTALGKGKSCTVTVQFAPTTAGQTYNATLTASGKKPPASASITLTGSGTASPDLILLPPAIFAGPTGDGSKFYNYFGTSTSPVPLPFTVLNNGSAASQMLQLTGGGTGFSLNSGSCAGATLAAHGGSCTFSLFFFGVCPLPLPPQNFFAIVDIFGLPVVAHYIHLEAHQACIPT